MKSKVNEIKISYKDRIKIAESESINSSQTASRILFDNWNKDTIALNESFKVLLLNNSNKVKGIFELSKGSITGTMVDVRILFAVVLKSLAVGIILAHNHPSGKLEASKADRDITKKIQEASKMLDIKLLDHLIITPNGSYFSFADNGLL